MDGSGSWVWTLIWPHNLTLFTSSAWKALVTLCHCDPIDPISYPSSDNPSCLYRFLLYVWCKCTLFLREMSGGNLLYSTQIPHLSWQMPRGTMSSSCWGKTQTASPQSIGFNLSSKLCGTISHMFKLVYILGMQPPVSLFSFTLSLTGRSL